MPLHFPALDRNVAGRDLVMFLFTLNVKSSNSRGG